MLEKDPRARISAVDALKHPYFESNQVKIVVQPISLSDSTRDEIREDSFSSRFELIPSKKKDSKRKRKNA